MAKLDPTVFNRLRFVIDDFTDAAHLMVQHLDIEIGSAAGSSKNELYRFRELIADLGSQLDLSDPDGCESTEAWAHTHVAVSN